MSIHMPQSLNEAMHLYKRYPDALIYAGGTYILQSQRSKFIHLPEEVISLQRIEELQRFVATERAVEIGATVSIERIQALGKDILPDVFVHALRHVGPPGIASFATLGGNLCIRHYNISMLPVIHVLDARIELRRQGHSHWLNVPRFRREDGTVALEDSEILTRIRIPTGSWNVQVYRRFGAGYGPKETSLTFAALARTEKGVIEDLRLCFGATDGRVLRNREMEVELIGHSLPLGRREYGIGMTGIQEVMRPLESSIHGDRIHRMIQWFFSRISTE